MNGRTQWFAVSAVVVVIGGGLAFAAMTADEGGVVAPGSPAPAFAAQSVPDAHAATVTKGIADYRGQAVLLNIWATWCGPCREEMPRIERLRQEFGPQGLAVVAVSIDNPGMADAIREFRKEMALSFEILYDESGKIRDDYQTSGVPETFLIDKQGVVRRRLIGASWTVDDQRALLRDLIAEPAK